MDLTPSNKDSLQLEAQTWAARARDLLISSTESCTDASYLLRSIKGIRSDIQTWFAPHVEAAMETKRRAEDARKALVNEQLRMEAPLIEAETHIKRALLVYEQDQERLRRSEEARLQAEAQVEAERATLAAAAELERTAGLTGDAGMLAEAYDILDQPIQAPVVSVKPFMPKVQGVTYRDQWKAHPDIDVRALAAAVASGKAPANFLLPNLTAINQFARATQGTQDISGVRFVNERQIAARG